MENKEKTKKKNTKFHSEIEERLVNDILKTDLDTAENELDKRIVVQHRDSYTGIDCFNAFSKKVLIHDDNGKRIVINNREEIKKHKKKTAIENSKNVIENTNTVEEDEVEFDD